MTRSRGWCAVEHERRMSLLTRSTVAPAIGEERSRSTMMQYNIVQKEICNICGAAGGQGLWNGIAGGTIGRNDNPLVAGG